MYDYLGRTSTSQVPRQPILNQKTNPASRDDLLFIIGKTPKTCLHQDILDYTMQNVQAQFQTTHHCMCSGVCAIQKYKLKLYHVKKTVYINTI